MTAVMVYVRSIIARFTRTTTTPALVALEVTTVSATSCSYEIAPIASRNNVSPLLGEIRYWATVYANAYFGCRINHLPAYQNDFQTELAKYRTHLEFAIACFNLERRKGVNNVESH